MSMVTYPLNNIEYTAEDAELFHVTRTSGIYANDSFNYSVSGADNAVVIGTGIGWIKNSEFSGKVIAQKESISLDMGLPDSVYPRIDAIVIQFDSNRNETNIVAKTGVASSMPVAPTVVRTESVYELHLYHVLREAGSLYITPSNITDLRLDSSYCGLMADSVTNIDTTAIEMQVADLIESLQNEISNVIDGSAYLLRNGSTNMTGNLPMNGHKVTELGTPTADGDAVPKKYVDSLSASDVGAVSKTGDTMTGHLNVPGFAIQADYDWPSFSISNINNPGIQARMQFDRPGSFMFFTIEDTANGIAEHYTLPSLTATETTWYRILTTKDIGEISSTASASNNYHTAHFAKIGKTVICTLLPKALGSTVQYEETITIPTGYRPSAQTSFPFFSDTAKNAGDSAGKVEITANTNGSLYISATYGFTLAEVSKTICWVTA